MSKALMSNKNTEVIIELDKIHGCLKLLTQDRMHANKQSDNKSKLKK